MKYNPMNGCFSAEAAISVWVAAYGLMTDGLVAYASCF